MQPHANSLSHNIFIFELSAFLPLSTPVLRDVATKYNNSNPIPLPSDLSAVNAICQRISRDISAAINNAKPDTINATADNKLSSSVACIFSMAKRVIASVAKTAPGNKTVNAKMKILHALLVAVAKAVGMRIKQECEDPWLDALVKFYERRCLFLFRFLLFVFFFSRKLSIRHHAIC